MGGELALPVGEPRPLAVAKERRPRPVEGVRVAEAAAADAIPRGDEDVLEDREAKDAPQPDARHPKVAAQVPGRLGEVLVAKSPPALQYADPVALLGEAERRNASPEPRADHEPVVVVCVPPSAVLHCREHRAANRRTGGGALLV